MVVIDRLKQPENRSENSTAVPEQVVYDCCTVNSMADDDFLFEDAILSVASPSDSVLLDAGIESRTGTEDRDFDLL